ncbi:MAG: shikimate kinase [Bacteroidetes bacterium]|nr:shikimate kinase [Bacteroidota bacterium]
MQLRIFLIGFMGSGKTTMGSILARKMGYEFVDMDQLIEDTARMTVPGIFSEHGEEVFRKWERDILQELCLREKVVIATGGGAPCHGEMMTVMNDNGATVYIKLTPAVLKDRLMQSKTDRPLIRGKSEEELLEFIKTVLEKREIFYLRANHIIDGINLGPDQLAELLED